MSIVEILEVRKTNPVGVDAVIDKLQHDLFFELTKQGWENYKSYPRVYRNKQNKDLVPDVYIGNNEYESALFDDTYSATSFFLIDTKRKYDPKKFNWTQDCAMIFQVNLSKLFKCDKDRADEELIDSIRLSIKRKFWSERLDEIITGVDDVFSGLKWNVEKKILSDMSDFAVVRINFKLIYTDTKIVTPLQ